MISKEEIGLELPMAEGLTGKKKSKSYGLYNQLLSFTLPKYTMHTFLTNLEWGLRSKGILKPKDRGLV